MSGDRQDHGPGVGPRPPVDRSDPDVGASERPPRSEHRQPSLRGFARRLLFDDPPRSRDGQVDPDRDEEGWRRIEARAVLAALLETGDKAKTETVRLVAREVRSYLDALELHKDLNHLLTNYSIEVKASIHLSPLHHDEDGQVDRQTSASVGLRKRAEGNEDPADD
ncbi:MAG: hypothetical protein GXP62_06175 [Oligoflexia bacterium]|nr:hypothetical protein [Oligoflexia bacterium]